MCSDWHGWNCRGGTSSWNSRIVSFTHVRLKKPAETSHSAGVFGELRLLNGSGPADVPGIHFSGSVFPGGVFRSSRVNVHLEGWLLMSRVSFPS